MSKPISMAIRLRSKPRYRWGKVEFRWAVRRAIPYLRRAKKIRGRRLPGKQITKNQIALRNWGYDAKKRKRGKKVS